MAKSKKGKKYLIFGGIFLVLAGLTVAAVLKKREPVITVQTEKVVRRSLTELVTANGRIQPVTQVKISAEVSGEIIDLPVKEGQCVQKGDLVVKIKPDFYVANRNQAEAGYKSSLAGKATAEANSHKAAAEFRRIEDLFKQKLVSDSTYDEAKAGFEVATAQLTNSEHQVEMARANLASADEQLSKTTIMAPLTGTVSKLNSQIGERVLGTVQNIGTEIMTIADLNEMEARVDIGEVDVVLINPGQNVRLEVDAFKDKKFSGTVTEIANSSRNFGSYGTGQQQDATKFEVRIRVKEKEAFRPGMSITAEVETRSRSNALTVPIASVTTRLPKEPDKKKAGVDPSTNANTGRKTATNLAATSISSNEQTNTAKADKKGKEAKPIEVVFVAEGDHVKMVPVKIGISDDSYWEITEGLKEGQEVVSGGYRAISRDLEDGKKVRKGPPPDAKDGKDAKDTEK